MTDTLSGTFWSALAWPYANGSLHVGHLAGVYVPADIFARFQRLRGNDVLMVSGSDEHGTPITVRAEQEGVTRPGGRRPLPRGVPRLLARPRASATTCTPGPAPTTTARSSQDEFLMLLDKRLPRSRRRCEALYDPSGQPLPARPLRRGHLPALRLRAGARRPVRQLRPAARPERSDRPAQPIQRRAAGAPRDRALLPRPAQAQRAAAGLGREQDPLAPERLPLHHQLPRERAPAARDHPRPALGRADPVRRATRTSGSTSGSRPCTGYLSASIEWAAAHGRARRLGALVEGRRPPPVLLHRQGQHPLPHRSSGRPS